MTSGNELAALLARAAATGLASAATRADSADEALGLVINAIRDTILPRTLSIRANTGACLIAEASGGYLLTLREVKGAAAGDLIGRPLRGSDEKDLSEVAVLLTTLFAEEGQITIESTPLPAPPDPTQSGISAAWLLSELSLAAFAAAVPDALAYFREAAAEVVLALHTPDSAGTSLQEGFTTPPAVANAISEMLSDADSVLNEFGEGEILFLAPGADPDLALALTRDGDAPLAFVLDADSLPELAAYWSGMAHGIVRLDA